MILDKQALALVGNKINTLTSLKNEDERFALLLEIGEIWQNQVQNIPKAIAAYVDATKIKPDDRPTLHKLIPLYQAVGQWRELVEVIAHVAELEENGEKRARHYYTMGIVFRDEIKNPDEAVKYFDLSLDGSMEDLKSFEAIDRILTEREEWKALEQAYRRMLDRVEGTGQDALELNLWHFLGELCRTRLLELEPAVEAFENAMALDPDSAGRHQVLAELYQALPDRAQDAIKEYQWLIRNNPYHVDSYKILRKLHIECEEFDKAWCVCATLAFLKKADADEQQFFEQYRLSEAISTQARLGNEHWLRDLFHPEESIYVGKILEAVTNVTRNIKIQPIKAVGLSKWQKRPLKDKKPFSKAFYYAAQVLNLPVVPDLYIQKSRPGGLHFAITEPMATVCGAGLLSGYSKQELLFVVGTHLTYYRPEHYIRWALPTQGELKMLLLAAIKIGAPESQLPKDETGVLDEYVNVLQTTLQPVEREYLIKVVTRFIKKNEVVDIEKWIRCVELTGCRAGLLLCNDIEVAARMIQSDVTTVDDIPDKEKIKELILFSVSEEYFRLREHLGITINAQ
jgi:tetratricopeptide (TPR) repeat protein